MGLQRDQRQLLLPLGVGMALSLMGDQTLYAVLPNQVEEVGVTLASVGLLLGANRLIRIPGNLLAGALNDRLGRRRLYLAGLFLGMLSTASYGLVRGLWPLLASRLLWGVAWSLINVGGYTMILDRSTPGDRGRMAGLYQMAFATGLLASPIVGGVLTDLLGFRGAVLVGAAISGLGLAVALLALPETRLPAGMVAPSGRIALPRSYWVALQSWRGRLDRQMLLAAAIYLVTLLVNSGVLMATASLLLRSRAGEILSGSGMVLGVASAAGALLGLRALVMMLSGPLAGLLSDLLRDRWGVVRAALLVGTAGFVGLALPTGPWMIPAGVALVAASAGALAATLAALVGDRADPGRPGVTMGGLATAGDLGSAAGPLFAYALLPTLGLHVIYLFCALALAACLVAVLCLARGPRGVRD
jgi:MFS family permease